MGGRGAGSGINSIASIRSRYGIKGDPLKTSAWYGEGVDETDAGYDGGGNPQLIKYQGQEEDKTARYLAKVWNETDYDDYQDGKWGYHDNSYQKLVLNMGLNNKPTVMDDDSFEALRKKTGAAVFYRGWSSADKADRFEQSKYFHTGGGIYGDGIYFLTRPHDAGAYSGAGQLGHNMVSKLMLNPKAKVISVQDVRAAIDRTSPSLQTALHKAGKAGTDNGYGGNSGEAQMALKMGYNVIKASAQYYVALTADALIVSKKRL